MFIYLFIMFVDTYRWFGENTPGKRKSCSDIWNYVKRLKPGNPLSKEGNTHVCLAEIPRDEFGGTVCNHAMKLHSRSKGSASSWITTRALEHMAKFHKQTQLAKEYLDRADVAHGAKVKPHQLYVTSYLILS
jgi:hypothetical protein